VERAVDLILDSGAYSCWKRKESLTLQEYIDFIHQYPKLIHEAVNLDRIPGEWGRVPSTTEVEASASEGWDNLIEMRKQGIEAMPVYHMGERRYWLEKMIGEGFNYIGISPANDRTTAQKVEWLDDIFHFLCGDKGYPQVKTHGFGVTALPILDRYPWFSADSITWVLIGVYGGVLIPQWAGDHYDYSLSPLVVSFSERDLVAGNNKRKDHITSFGKTAQKYILDYIEQEGFDVAKIREDYSTRLHVNCRFFKRASENYHPKPFFPTVIGFFNRADKSPYGFETNQFGNFHFIFTVNTTEQHSRILNEENCRDRLMSYYYFKNGEAFDLQQYILTGGVVKVAKVRTPKAATAAKPKKSVKEPKPHSIKKKVYIKG